MKDYDLIIGIDNGLKGGVCALSYSHGLIVDYLKMPVRESIKPREIDALSLRKWLKWASDSNSCLVVLEMPVGSKSLNAAKSMASSFHAVRGCVEAMGIDFDRIKPSEWQRDLLKGIRGKDTKEKALKVANKLFPNESFILPRCRVPHDGIIDAALIAYHHINK